MKKEVLVLFFFIILLSAQLALADPVDDQMQRLTNSAEQYEIGNINYVQLLVLLADVRESLNEDLGAISREEGGILRQDQIESILGEPDGLTKWVWVEGREHDGGHDKRVDESVPEWRKIVFDGNKIQIRIEAYPSIIERIDSDELVYRLHFNIEFKRPGEQLDIEERIVEIQKLAEIFSADPSRRNAEILAEASVNAERAFEQSFNQGGENCEALMNDVIGSENKRESQELILQEFDFFEGDNFIAVMNLEMCDDCSDWHWINLNMWFEGRGPGFDYRDEGDFDRDERSRFQDLSFEEFEEKTKELIEKIRKSLEEEDISSARRSMNDLRRLTDNWNEVANNVWDDFEFEYEDKTFASEEVERDYYDNYGWIKEEQERREKIRAKTKSNYEVRKSFYSGLFADYDKIESRFVENNWEKRLVEEFKEFGEEVCDNNLDDNDNGQVDCSDSQCGGKICGKLVNAIIVDDATFVEETVLYCIAGTCQVKEEIFEDEGPICGNNICEPGEAIEEPVLQQLAAQEEEAVVVENGEDGGFPPECAAVDCRQGFHCVSGGSCVVNEDEESIFCPQDCAQCIKHEPIECVGDVIFSGEDESGCQLEPICIEEEEFCEVNEDCTQPLCANVGCIEGICQVIELTECKETECIDGEERIQHCDSGESVVIEKCLDGLWESTRVECRISEGESCNQYCWDQVAVISFSCPGNLEISGSFPDCSCDWICEEVVGDECTVKNDCGGENDVCSNGKCVTLPEVIDEDEEHEEEIEESPEEETDEEAEEEQEQEEPQESPEPAPEPEPTIAGNAIFNLFKTLGNNLNFVALQDDGGDGGDDTGGDGTDDGGTEGCPDPGEPPEVTDECWYEETYDSEGCVTGYDYYCNDEGEYEDFDHEDDYEEYDREGECDRTCDEFCYNSETRPCTEDCIFEECGQELDCNVDEVKVSCETQCDNERNIDACENNCLDRCISGEDIWEDFEYQEDEYREEKGVFTVGGSCRTSQGRTEAFVWFGGWGTFDEIHRLKEKYYSGGESDWCKNDFENLKKQRKEFEKGFNQEFARWFFEEHLTNSAGEWHKAMSGIFEVYWGDVDNSRQITDRMMCLNIDKFPDHKLITVEYETDYGKIKFWEELEVKKLYNSEKETEIISPFMELWIFPSRDFFKLEMKKAMERHEMPGPPEDRIEKRNQPSEEEKRELIEDGILEDIREFNEKYGENVVVQFVDFETGEIVFNIDTRINPEEIIYFEPKLPEENSPEDIRIELDVEKLLDIVEFMESDRVELESPPWSPKRRVGVVRGVTDNVNMFFKFRALMNSVRVYPESAEPAGKFYMRDFFTIIMGDDGPEGRDDFEGEEFGEGEFEDRRELPEGWEERGIITGEVVRS